jgi:hypothetical protein
MKILEQSSTTVAALSELFKPIIVDSQLKESTGAKRHPHGGPTGQYRTWRETYTKEPHLSRHCLVSLVKHDGFKQQLKSIKALGSLLEYAHGVRNCWEDLMRGLEKDCFKDLFDRWNISFLLEVGVMPISNDATLQVSNESSRPTVYAGLRIRVLIFKHLLDDTRILPVQVYGRRRPLQQLMSDALKASIFKYAPTRAFPIQEILSSWQTAKALADKVKTSGQYYGLWLVPLLCHDKREAIAQPAALKVTMQDYQLQALKFMADRERAPFGVSSFLYVPLMIGSTRCWYSLVSATFATKEPPCIRGGLLCSAMGLGKTVICCALMLLIPPQRKLGTVARKTTAMMDGKEHQLCRGGTLVVCAVSLVTQWIEEAENRTGGALSIYCYHGRRRTRDPREISKYDVVVTTYGTLASDYSRTKLRPANTSPLHLVRWHRLIMDESHCLKDPYSVQSQGCREIIATRRWCVTGTPVVNDLNDIRNQLKALSPQEQDRFCLDNWVSLTCHSSIFVSDFILWPCCIVQRFSRIKNSLPVSHAQPCHPSRGQSAHGRSPHLVAASAS